ncbi:MAG: hypothetical protein JWO82_1364, partial [Akkermansiaceae bacterium]|nr:hypothetical protein [Akkermansiaceae bacterium]
MRIDASHSKAALTRPGLLCRRPLALLACLATASCMHTPGTVAVLRKVDRHQVDIDLTTTTL